MVTDQERRELFEALDRELGAGPAATLMELLPPVGWADVARQSDLVAVRGEMAQLRGEMAELRAQLKGEIANLRGEIHAQLPKLYAANAATAIAVAGLVLAAAKLT
jgi:hypothetical protein